MNDASTDGTLTLLSQERGTMFKFQDGEEVMVRPGTKYAFDHAGYVGKVEKSVPILNQDSLVRVFVKLDGVPLVHSFWEAELESVEG